MTRGDEGGSSADPAEAAPVASPLHLAARATTGHRRALAVVGIVALVGGFTEAGVLVLIARLAFALASGDTQLHLSLGPLGTADIAVPVLIGIAAALVLIRVGLQVFQISLMTRANTAVLAGVRSRLLRLYVGASWALQSEQRSGRLQELATTYAGAVSGTVASLTQAMVASFSLLAFLVTAVFVNVIAAIVVTAVGAGVALILRPMRHLIRRLAGRAADANLAFATEVTELSANLQEVRVFNVEEVVLDRIEERIDESSRLGQRAAFVSGLAPTLYQGLALLLIVGAVGAVYASGATRLASFGGIILIMIRSLSYGQQLQSNYQNLHASAPYFEMLADEESRYLTAAVTRSGDPIEHVGPVTFDDVWYEYQPGRPVLKGVSLQLQVGEIVGIIGPSGSGKSTLVQLLLRLREPTGGRVLAGGRDVRELSLDDWYDRVSFVPQDARLFAGSIADNIRFFRNDLGDDAVERSAKLANLHDEIMAMPEGYDTPVGERGGHLSGGQQQRLSIARALAEEPDVLVLDEPTSSLDVRSEALIRETLKGLAERTTVVVIAHRLSTLDVCDRIMVVYEGSIQGFDTPDRLEATDPFYREALQLSGLR
jgi:ABC-type multidrug transport system fused ATPase/permease subunit